MDPTAQQLQGMASLNDVLQWVGVSQGVADAVNVAMGTLVLVREVVLIPAAAWDDAVLTLRVITTAAVAADPTAQPPVLAQPQVDRAPNAVELGQVASVRRGVACG